MNLVDPYGLCSLSHPGDCAEVGLTKAIDYGADYIQDKANRIGIEKGIIAIGTGLVCAGAVAAPESIVLPAACIAGISGYLFAQEYQWVANCENVASGKLSADRAYGKNVLSAFPLPLGLLGKAVVNPGVKRAIGRGPHFLPGLQCGSSVAEAASAFQQKE